MTPKQLAYIQHRASGLPKSKAAIAAGYAPGSAEVTGSRMERDPRIAEAIAEARTAIPPAAEAEPAIEFEDAASYLHAVVSGAVVPCPIRVAAAKALLPYQRARERAPVASRTPRQMQQQAASAAESDQMAEWRAKVEAAKAKLALAGGK